jgi:Flp pilus assembly protein TadG
MQRTRGIVAAGKFVRFLTRFADDRAGVSAIMLGLAITVMMGFAGLAVDGGVWYADRRAAQGAADAAAFSAAVDYTDSASPSAAYAKATALAVAAQYGFTNGVGGVTVTVNSPATSGNYTAASANAIEVIISKSEPVFFSSLYLTSAAIKARAVAVPGAASKYCVEVLNSNSSIINTLFNVGAHATIDLSDCGMVDDGPSSCALNVTGNANLVAQNLSVVGNVCAVSPATVTVSGAKAVGAAPIANPYSALSLATVEGSTSMSCGVSPVTSSGQTYTISPGVYCGLNVASGATLNMNPGVYYINGGVLNLQSGSTTNANGVTIILTGNLVVNYATANIAPGATLNLTAPTTGLTAGLALWSDPASPIVLSQPLTSILNGGSAMTINGALYFPTQMVDFSNGSANSAACTQLVAYEVTFEGGSRFSNECIPYAVKPIGSNSRATLAE